MIEAIRAGVLAAVLSCGLALLSAAPAEAALGGGRSSVEGDRIHLSARMSTAQTPSARTVHSLILANGGEAQEFENGEGVVFAVAWRGPARPDLRQLLGDHFETLQAETVVRAGRLLRAPPTVNRSDLVVRTAGHPGAFWGFAYLPQVTPPDFSPSEMQ